MSKEDFWRTLKKDHLDSVTTVPSVTTLVVTPAVMNDRYMFRLTSVIRSMKSKD